MAKPQTVIDTDGSVEEYYLARLVENGLMPDEARATLDYVQMKMEQGHSAPEWGSPMSGYPPGLHTTLWLAVRAHAFDYLKAEVSTHWCLPLFAPDFEAELSDALERMDKELGDD